MRKENEIYCSNCGVLINIDSRFCPSCGMEQLNFDNKLIDLNHQSETKLYASSNLEDDKVNKSAPKSKWNIWLIIIGILVLSSIIFNVNKVKCISCNGTGRNDELGAGGVCRYCEGSGKVSKSVNKRNFGIEELK